MASRAARPKADDPKKHADPMSYPDHTDLGHTEAHKALGRDRHSFMFEQVGGSWRGYMWARESVYVCARASVNACVYCGVCGQGDGGAYACACAHSHAQNWLARCARRRLLGRDGGQVRSVWVARNWCWVFAATVGMVLPAVVEPHVVPWSAAHALARASARAGAPCVRTGRAHSALHSPPRVPTCQHCGAVS